MRRLDMMRDGEGPPKVDVDRPKRDIHYIRDSEGKIVAVVFSKKEEEPKRGAEE